MKEPVSQFRFQIIHALSVRGEVNNSEEVEIS